MSINMTVDSSLMEQEHSQFPSVSVENMNQFQLRELIPKLVHVISQRSNMKPDWWPENLSWSGVHAECDSNLEDPSYTEVMRNVVRKCYRQFGQEDLLSARPNIQKLHFIKSSPSRGMVLQEVNQMPPNYNNANTQCEKDSRHQTGRTEPVWICIMCAKAFTDQDTLMKHQDACDDDIETERPLVVAPLKRLIRRPKRKRKFFVSELYNFPSQDTYFASLGLAPPPKIGKFISTRKTIENESSTMTLKDFEEPCSPAKTPHTPKYKSQRSWEGESGSACKRKFSFSSPSHHCEESDDSSQDDEQEAGHGVSLRNSLLCIDFSSELGKKFNKFLKPVSSMPLVPTFESYCSTPMKNEFLEKLRYRSSDYPVTFKAKKKYLKSYCHEMKFGFADRRDFVKKMKTGLSKKSRLLKESLSKCHVVLNPVTKSEIENWSHPRHRAIRQVVSYPQQMFYIDNDSDCQPRPMMLFRHGKPVIQDFRLHGPSRIMGTPTAQSQSYPELQKQLLAPSPSKLVNGSQPNLLPHFVVKKVDKNFDGQESQRFMYVPMFHKDTGDGITQQGIALPGSSENSPKRDCASQRRKQNFEKIRDDDEICIVCMSSDEEDNQAEKFSDSVKHHAATKNLPLTVTKSQSRVLGNSTSTRPAAKLSSRDKPCILTSQSQVARNNAVRRTAINQQDLNWVSSQQQPRNPALEILRAQLESKRNFNAQLAQARSNPQAFSPVIRSYMNNASPCTFSSHSDAREDDNQLTIAAVYSLNESGASKRTVLQPVNKFPENIFVENTGPISAASPDIATVVATVNDYNTETHREQNSQTTTPVVSRIQVENEIIEVICIDDDD